jgi:hypothetical protein
MTASSAPLPATAEPGATPALADQWEAEAIGAIESVATPDEAETLLGKVRIAASCVRIAKLGRDRSSRWSRITLQAERRYGELLPPKKKAGRKSGIVSHADNSSGPQREAQSQARKVAEVPKKKFDEYVNTEKEPSRAGLLRKAAGKVKPKPKAPPKPVSPRARNGKKPTKTERKGVLWLLHDVVEEYAAKLEHIDPRVVDVSKSEDLETLVHIRDALIDLDIWKGDVERTITAKIGDEGIREKIASLRNPDGKYAEELKRCLEVADRLERRLNNKLAA